MPTLDLTTAIGSPFDVRRFTVHESIPGPYVAELVAIPDEHSLDLESIVGQGASFNVSTGYALAHGGKRAWSGVCSYIEQVQGMQPGRDGTQAKSTYKLRLMPNLWLLGQRKNHRIYQRLSIP